MRNETKAVQALLIFTFQNIKPLVSIGLYNNLNFNKNINLCRIGFPVKIDSCYVTSNEQKSSPDRVDKFPKKSQRSEIPSNIGKGGVWYYI